MGRWFLLLRYLSPAYIRLYWRLMRDRRVPGLSKALVAAALVYVIFPRTFCPTGSPFWAGSTTP